MLVCIIWIIARISNAENILLPLLNAAVEHPEWIFFLSLLPLHVFLSKNLQRGHLENRIYYPVIVYDCRS